MGISIAASNNVTGTDGDWELEIGNNSIAFVVNDYKYNLQCAGTVCGLAPGDDFDTNFNPETGTNNAGSTIESSWYRNNLPWRAYNEYACHLDTHKQHRAAICLTHAFYAHSTKYSCAHKRLFANRNR